MSAGNESWHDERERLVKLLKRIDKGEVTHIDEDGLRQLQPTNPDNIDVVRNRLAELNRRLGYN